MSKEVGSTANKAKPKQWAAVKLFVLSREQDLSCRHHFFIGIESMDFQQEPIGGYDRPLYHLIDTFPSQGHRRRHIEVKMLFSAAFKACLPTQKATNHIRATGPVCQTCNFLLDQLKLYRLD